MSRHEENSSRTAKPISSKSILEKAKPIADDAQFFENLLEEDSNKIRTLESRWLYQLNEQVYGPVYAKEILELLYKGILNAESLVAPEDHEFQALGRFGVFRPHLQRSQEHQAVVREEEEKEKAEHRNRFKRRLRYWGAGIFVSLLISSIVVYRVREIRQAQAKKEKEEAIQRELASLMSRITLEPPLIPLEEPDDDEPTPPPPEKEQSRRRLGSKNKKNRSVVNEAQKTREVGKRSGSGTLSRGEIISGVQAALPGLKRCIVEQIRSEPDTVPPQIIIEFSVSNAGKAQEVLLKDRTLRKSPMGPCVGREFARLKWRAYVGEVQNIEYPIMIRGR